MEALGGSNPYVVLEWSNNKFDSMKTASIRNTTSPIFNKKISNVSTTLAAGQHKFKYEFIFNLETYIYKRMNSSNKYNTEMLSDLFVIVYSQNRSISDELLGKATLKESYFMTFINPLLLVFKNDHYSGSTLKVENSIIQSNVQEKIIIPLLFHNNTKGAGFIELNITFEW
jgi:hypothetical protein